MWVDIGYPALVLHYDAVGCAALSDRLHQLAEREMGVAAGAVQAEELGMNQVGEFQAFGKALEPGGLRRQHPAGLDMI